MVRRGSRTGAPLSFVMAALEEIYMLQRLLAKTRECRKDWRAGVAYAEDVLGAGDLRLEIVWGLSCGKRGLGGPGLVRGGSRAADAWRTVRRLSPATRGRPPGAQIKTRNSDLNWRFTPNAARRCLSIEAPTSDAILRLVTNVDSLDPQGTWEETL